MWFVAGALTERTQRWKGYKRGEVEVRHNERKYGKTKFWLGAGGLRFAIRERGFARETAELAQVVCLK